MRSLRRPLLALLAAGLLFGLSPAPADACGGFFCQTQPVDQAGERILFAVDGEDVTAHVQIQYAGSAEKFAWVVPVPTAPTLGVGTDALFTALRSATRPVFRLNLRTEGSCEFGRPPSGWPMPSAPPASLGGSGVVAVEQQVGPYDTAVLQANDPQALRTWLRDNGYDIPPSLDPLLDPYVAGKFYFVALKLQKDRATGDLQPIVLRYKSTKPGIPIRLTAIAATPDMDVYAWVLGKHRAIPENYRHAVINEARIDWLNAGSNYRSVVTEAINEAGGQAFVTDYAGPSAAVPLAGLDSSRFDLDTLRTLTEPVAFVETVIQKGYLTPPGTPMWVSPTLTPALYSFLRRYVPKPESLADVADPSFYGGIRQHAAALSDAQVQVEAASAAAELEETVVAPLREARALLGRHAYVTALYSTISPEEMTVDPTFLFNPDLPPQSNMHEADGVRDCLSEPDFYEAPVHVTLRDGTTYTMKRTQGNSFAPAASLPATLRVEQLRAFGAPSLIQDNATAITAALTPKAASSPIPIRGTPTPPEPAPTPVAPPSGGFGCFGNSAAPAPLQQGAGDGITLGAFMFGWWRLTRRRR